MRRCNEYGQDIHRSSSTQDLGGINHFLQQVIR